MQVYRILLSTFYSRDIVLTDSNIVDAKEGVEVPFENETRSSFLSQIDEIFHACPSHVQCGLFSATIDSSVQELASNILKNPIYITIGIIV